MLLIYYFKNVLNRYSVGSYKCTLLSRSKSTATKGC
jgi:hypothetical protein